MRRALLKILRDPKTGEALDLHSLASASPPRGPEEDVSEGILVSQTSRNTYPVVGGVPVMLESAFAESFLEKHAGKISQDPALSELEYGKSKQSAWSFSAEWEQHHATGLTKTWGWTVEQRVEQFFLETETDPGSCAGQWVLDAGCGNGQLTEGLSNRSMNVVGMDFSEGVYAAERNRTSPNVHFVHGDLQAPPFEPSTFDTIISNGVLHHTPNTYTTFCAVAKLVRQGGRFYLWLYCRRESFLLRCVVWPAIDALRYVVARLPHRPQAIAVKSYAFLLRILHKVVGTYQDESWPETIVNAYDTLSPMWRHYHTPQEVGRWFFLNGFSAGRLTHWDTPLGFGMFAERSALEDSPGDHFGKRNEPNPPVS